MRFGFFAMPEHFPWDNWTLSYDRDIANMVFAEELGFEEFWIGEHHSGGYENIPAPEFMIAKASALTHRIRLGTGVVNLPYHDPFLVAERLAFLDHLTHGRLYYGLGAGALLTDRELFGMQDEHARPRMLEAMGVIEKLLTTREPISHDGTYWNFENRRIQVPPYQENPPIAIAGLTGTHNFSMCGERGYLPLSVYFTPAEAGANLAFPDLTAHGKALVDAAEKAGRDPEVARDEWRIVREVYVAEDRDTAMREIRAGVKTSYDYLMAFGLGALMKRDAAMPDAELTFEWMTENIPWIIGSPDDCVQEIQELREEVGGFGVLLINCRDWVSSDLWRRSAERFARYVIPAFRGREYQVFRNNLAREAIEFGKGYSAGRK